MPGRVGEVGRQAAGCDGGPQGEQDEVRGAAMQAVRYSLIPAIFPRRLSRASTLDGAEHILAKAFHSGSQSTLLEQALSASCSSCVSTRCYHKGTGLQRVVAPISRLPPPLAEERKFLIKS